MKARKGRRKQIGKEHSKPDPATPAAGSSKRVRMSRPREFALNLRCLVKDIVQGPEAWRKVSFHCAGLKRSVRLK